MPKFKMIDIGSSGISLCPTPVPPGPWSGPTAAAPIRALCCPSAIHVMYPSSGFAGFAQYSKPA